MKAVNILLIVIPLQIVWDPDKKRWINQDEGEAEGEAFKPPPKMSELNLPQQQQQQPPQMQTPIPAMSQGMPPPAQSPAFMGAPAPVPTPSMAPMMMMNPGQQQPSQQQQPSVEDASAVDGGGNRVPTNNLQSNQFKLQRNRSKDEVLGCLDRRSNVNPSLQP